MLQKSGDIDAAIAEYRLGLRLQAKDGNRHFGLGLVDKKDEWNAAIVELTFALHHDIDTPFRHYPLWVALEGKGDLASGERIPKAAKDMPQNDLYLKARD